MDKRWMGAPRWSDEYEKGLHEFIELAFSKSAEQNRILCPFTSCGNNYWLAAEDVQDHLISMGFMDGYTTWIHHGEGMSSSVPNVSSCSQSEEGNVGDDEMDQMLMEGFGMYDSSALGEDEGDNEPDVDAEAYYKLVSDGSQQLYPSCKRFSKLQFLVRLLHLKNIWGMSNGCFDDLLSLIKEALPEGEVLPKNFYEAKKFVKGFFDIDESYKPWVLKSASKKWKDFKAVLKRKYFDPNLSRRQNISNGCARRISAPQWVWLVNHWESNESELKSEKNKATRALQLNGRHTTGSRSNAVVLDQLELKEGRKIGRAELYIATHTRKNGQPIDDYSAEKIDEITRKFEEDPSLIAEETHDNDCFSTLFPKERSGRRRGLGLLAGGTTSGRIFEALDEVQEVREENKKLWSVDQDLMSNQTKLQQQYDELKSQVSAPQKCPSVGSSPKVDPVPKDHSQATNDDNQGDSTSHPKKRSRAKLEETSNVLSQSQQKKKSKMSQLTLQKKLDDKTSIQSLQEEVKKPRKFQAPLHMDEMQAIKCGMEVGLASPNSKKMVAMGTVQNTDSRAKASDGNPLADCVEVLISVVFNQTTMLPRGHGKIQKLGSATAHCIAWPRRNIMKLKLNTVKGASQTVAKSKAEGKISKEKGKKDVTKEVAKSKEASPK